MKSFLIAFFIFLLWFFAGSWIYTCKIKAFCHENQKAGNTINVAEKIPGKKTVQHRIKNINVEQNALKAADTTRYEKSGAFTEKRVLYFDFDSKNYKTDRELKQYIATLKTYLNTHPGKKITITGHTDSVGETEDNEWIAMQRAGNAMEYFVSEGIPKERIALLSRGETDPVASNATDEGRRRNRRVEITVN